MKTGVLGMLILFLISISGGVMAQDGAPEERSNGAPPQDLQYEPPSNVKPLVYEKWAQEEAILSDISHVLRPELHPRFAIGARIGFSPLPQRAAGFPQIAVSLHAEYMYLSNLTLYLRGTFLSAFSFRDRTMALREYIDSDSEGKSNAAGFGGTVGGRLRLETEIKGIYMGLNTFIGAFKHAAFRTHIGVDNVETDDPTFHPNFDAREIYFDKAFLLLPALEAGITPVAGRFFIELGIELGIGLLIGDGEYIGLDDFNEEPTVVDADRIVTKFELFFNTQINFTMGFRI